MRERIFGLLLVLSLCLIPPAAAMADEAGEIVYEVKVQADGDAPGKVWLTGGAHYSSDALEIPETVTRADGEYTVTGIGELAFAECAALKTLAIPKTVTHIGEDAFFGCSSLEGITVAEDNPIYLGEAGVLYERTESGLTVVRYPQGKSGDGFSVPAYIGGRQVTAIGYRAFYGCGGLTRVAMPDGISTIGGGAFGDCFGLESMELPGGLVSIGESAFLSCTSLKSIEIPKGVVSMGNGQFTGCGSLEEILVEEGSSNYFSDDGVLYGVAGDGAVLIRYPEGRRGDGYSILAVAGSKPVTAIHHRAFYNCGSLKGVTIPAGISSIGGEAFRGCGGLEGITVPEGVSEIGEGAFEACPRLVRVELPKSAESIGVNPFDGCASLEEVIVAPGNPKYMAEDGFLYEITESGLRLMSYPEGKVGESLTIPASAGDMAVTAIGAYACNGSGLRNAVIPEGVTEIGHNAFSGSSIETVVLPGSLEAINSFAFNMCGKLTSVSLPSALSSIGEYAFWDSGLKDVHTGRTQEEWDRVVIGQQAMPESAALHFKAEAAPAAAPLDEPEPEHEPPQVEREGPGAWLWITVAAVAAAAVAVFLRKKKKSEGGQE